MVHTTDDWMRDGVPEHIEITQEQIRRFSPENLSLLEVQHPRDLEILDKIYRNSVLLKDLDIEYVTEFHLTNDSALWKPREWWEAQGYKPDGQGRWVGPDGAIALPLYEGKMFWQFDPSYNRFVKGRWERNPQSEEGVYPRFLMAEKDYVDAAGIVRGPKVAFRDIARATDQRTMIAALLPDTPCGNKAPVFRLGPRSPPAELLLAVLNSYAFDFAARNRVHGANLNWYLVAELPFPKTWVRTDPGLDEALNGVLEAVRLLNSRVGVLRLQQSGLRNESQRAALREELDRQAGVAYGLTSEDVSWILGGEAKDPRSLRRDYGERLRRLEAEYADES